MSQRIVSSSFKYESQNCHLFSTWLKELSPFWKICSKELIFFFLKRWKTQRTEPFLNDSKNWTLFSFRCDSQNWTFFKKKLIWLKELNLSGMRLKELSLFFECDSQNWALFSWFTELSPFYDSKNWTCFQKYDSEIEPFCSSRLKELNTFLSKKEAHRIDFFFGTWLKELNFF